MKFLNILFVLGLIVILSVGMTISHTNQNGPTNSLLKPGDLFPLLKLEAKLSSSLREYLGVGQKINFTINDIKADVILIEFFNKYCPHCQQQAPVLNQLFHDIQADKSLRSSVKMVGIGNGNNQRQLEYYTDEKNILFPLIPDPAFIFHDEIGRPRTPFIVLVKKDRNGNQIVGETFLGLVKSKKKLFKAIKKLATQEVLVFNKLDLKPVLKDEIFKTTRKLNRREFKSVVKNHLSREGIKILSFDTIILNENEIYYKLLINKNNKEIIIFINEVYRSTVCDVCHDVHFWYGFDSDGKITYFFPINLTKAYNQKWNDTEVHSFTKRILKRSILETFEFDPGIDAVTSATITSSIIFNTLNKGKLIFNKLK